MRKEAVLYLRSSKDRSAVSLAAQRRELTDLAKTKGLIVSDEYCDAVESGKDIDRPGFQRLLRDLKAKGRTWSAILIFDTSRVGRRRHIAEVFRHECKKLGIDLLFAKMPETDPISQVILESVFQAMDEVHSLMSREKGLAGMAENVRQGFRAGGRAPYGYKLEVIDTGNVREGVAVTKSKLVPDPKTADKIAAWLKGRAEGKSGARLANDLGIDLAKSSLTHLEWTALTYAGHTVWNMHRDKEGAAVEGRLRPRAEWIIQRDTHQALISNDEAEAILARREGNKAERATRLRVSDYLLTGLLVTPDGAAWHGNAGSYRTGSTNIKASMLEESVLEQVASDLQADELVVQLTEACRRAQMPSDGGELEALNKQIREIDATVKKLMGLIEQTTAPKAILRRIEERETEREGLAERLERLAEETKRAKALASIKESDVKLYLKAIADDLVMLDREHLKDALRGMLDAVVLCPKTRAGSIRFRISPTGVKVASPRGLVPNPTLSASMPYQAPRNRRAA